jgi:hypothetical protein
LVSLDPLRTAAAFGVACLAGIVNSIAGGGTLLTFPTLIWLGLTSVAANATSTVAMLPGAPAGMWGYRRELRQIEPRMLLLAAPSLVGGIAGALLLRFTPPAVFDKLAPNLILFATLLFMAQEPIQRRFKPDAARHTSTRWLAGAMLFQLLVAVYGGYFGAGIGILMLAALSILGMSDIHQMNGLKILLALAINGVAGLYFVGAKMVYWPDVIAMAVGAVVGGYGGAGVARRLGQKAVRRIVVGIGFGMALSLFLKK